MRGLTSDVLDFEFVSANQDSDDGTLNQLVGPRAASADPEILAKAQDMDAEGADRLTIWRETAKLGQPWYKDNDGNWITELPDGNVKVRRVLGKANAVIQNAQVFREYPELADMAVDARRKNENDSRSPGALGSFLSESQGRRAAQKIHDGLLALRRQRTTLIERMTGRAGPKPEMPDPIRIVISANNDVIAEYTAIHELQHAVDDLEGFDYGGSRPYGRRPGERRAMNAEYRRLWTMEERIAVPPWRTEQEAVNWFLGGRDMTVGVRPRYLKSGTMDPFGRPQNEDQGSIFDPANAERREQERSFNAGRQTRPNDRSVEATRSIYSVDRGGPIRGHVFLSEREVTRSKLAKKLRLAKPVEGENMVDLDAPLGEQPEAVRDRLLKAMEDFGINLGPTINGQPSFLVANLSEGPLSEIIDYPEESEIIERSKAKGLSRLQMLDRIDDQIGHGQQAMSELTGLFLRLYDAVSTDPMDTVGQVVVQRLLGAARAKHEASVYIDRGSIAYSKPFRVRRHKGRPGQQREPDILYEGMDENEARRIYEAAQQEIITNKERAVVEMLDTIGIIGGYFTPMGGQDAYFYEPSDLENERAALEDERASLYTQIRALADVNDAGMPEPRRELARLEGDAKRVEEALDRVNAQLPRYERDGQVFQTRGDLGRSLLLFDQSAPAPPTRDDGRFYSLRPEGVFEVPPSPTEVAERLSDEAIAEAEQLAAAEREDFRDNEVYSEPISTGGMRYGFEFEGERLFLEERAGDLVIKRGSGQTFAERVDIATLNGDQMSDLAATIEILIEPMIGTALEIRAATEGEADFWETILEGFAEDTERNGHTVSLPAYDGPVNRDTRSQIRSIADRPTGESGRNEEWAFLQALDAFDFRGRREGRSERARAAAERDEAARQETLRQEGAARLREGLARLADAYISEAFPRAEFTAYEAQARKFFDDGHSAESILEGTENRLVQLTQAREGGALFQSGDEALFQPSDPRRQNNKVRATVQIPGALTDFPGAQILGGRDTIVRFTSATDKTSFLHESAHIFLEIYAALEGENENVAARMADIRKWLKLEPGEKLTRDQHEKFAEAFEAYLMEGKAPNAEMKGVFRRFRAWFASVYNELKRRLLLTQLNDEARDIFD
ncbi:MAG: LPD23 domain-containing protein, partial [Pseudomonadota bacterium]